MKLTIQQIADLAKVSKATVSKVLNGYPKISKTTAERVLRLVKELDFQPNSSARALALQRTGIVGLLIPHESEASLSGYYWANILSSVSKEAGLQGYNLMVLTTPREGDIRSALKPILTRNNVDGLIIGSELLDKKSLTTLMSHHVPFLLLGQNPEFQHYCVDVDSNQGTSSLVRHMVEHGYRKIGALFGPDNYPYVRERHAAYLATLRDAGITWQASAFTDYYDPQGVVSHLNRLLDENPDMDCLFVSSGGELYFQAVSVLNSRGITVPEFGLGVFDDYPFLDHTYPAVTAVKQPLSDVGRESVTMLLQLIQGREPQEALVRLPTKLVLRGSLRD